MVAAAGRQEGLECRRFEVAGVAVELRQDVRGSGALRPLDDDRVCARDGGREDPTPASIPTADELPQVGLVVWQAGFVLADYLLRQPPYGAWHGTSVLDLGCGTGLVGICLALAGAEVLLSDQPHITPLAELNMQANLVPGLHRAQVVPYTWGEGNAAAALHQQPPFGDAAPSAQAAAAPLLAAASPGVWAGSASPVQGVAAAVQASTVLSAAAGAAAPQLAASGGEMQEQQACLPGLSLDCITAADVVYQPENYSLLAATLRELAAPHTLVFVAFKHRGLQEDSFLELLESQGFAVQEVPQDSLAPEYRTGLYRVVRACRIE
ncbi:Protein N-lysine methyltransferase METTL21A [Chlorella vulgaris]